MAFEGVHSFRAAMSVRFITRKTHTVEVELVFDVGQRLLKLLRAFK